MIEHPETGKRADVNDRGRMTKDGQVGTGVAAGSPQSTKDDFTGGKTLRSTEILGVRVHDVTIGESLGLMQEMIEGGGAHHVVTVNPEFVMMAQRNAEFRRVLAAASLALPDGIGIVHAARILGASMRQRVTGVDCVNRLAAHAAQRGYSLFLLGAAPGVAQKVGEILEARHPGLRVAGCYAGSPHPDEEGEICSMIEAAKPDILLVAYGAPKQDLWIARTRGRLRVPLAVGVGGTFDFIAGVSTRAPGWVQRVGLEWFYRLLHEPYRWRRMLSLPRFALSVLRAKFFHSPGGRS